MRRSQIQFPREQLERVRVIARSEGVSVAEVVRRAVDYYVEHAPTAGREEAMRSRARLVIRRYRSGYHDTSIAHDAHLAEAFLSAGSGA